MIEHAPGTLYVTDDGAVLIHWPIIDEVLHPTWLALKQGRICRSTAWEWELPSDARLAGYLPGYEPEHVDPAVVNGVSVMSRLSNGLVLCQLCAEYFWPAQLHKDAYGDVHDTCTSCAKAEEGM